MVWDGRCSRPAITGATDLAPGANTHVVEFPQPFETPPTIDVPDLPKDATFDLVEVTATGFTFSLTAGGEEPPPTSIEWVAAQTTEDEGA